MKVVNFSNLVYKLKAVIELVGWFLSEASLSLNHFSGLLVKLPMEARTERSGISFLCNLGRP